VQKPIIEATSFQVVTNGELAMHPCIGVGRVLLCPTIARASGRGGSS
jgi:hypothetical protein